jgi:2-polyprenyl-6-methoxyphenol hydroxylase-like FAD-dependent oxidoreductase
MAIERSARVLIVGGGPAGLVLAIELGRRGIPCIVFEQNFDTPNFPKANSTTSRTMEHYRRLGIADDIRQIGLSDDYPADTSYYTRYSRHELARLRWPSRREAMKSRHQYDPHWPTPEPVLRAQQMLIEPVLKRHAGKYPAIELRFGWRVEEIDGGDASVRLRATELATGRIEDFVADYAVGCDGPRSIVRAALGIKYEGLGTEEGLFLGGRMLAVHLDAPAFYDRVGAARSWQYWAINRERCAILIAIDGRGRFVFHTQLPRGQKGTLDYARESLALAMGKEFPCHIMAIAEWTAGFTLVAERYGTGRIFLAGDAVHLFTPTAGLGYNTSVDDAANLGWKLAAVIEGWGGPGLLASYETERKPVAYRNTRFARSIAEFFRGIELPSTLEDDGPDGAAARAALGPRLHALSSREFDAPGVHFGMFYGDSPIVAVEDGGAPPDDPGHYVPSAKPGARAPHAWLGEGVALYDRFGRDFTLLRLARHATSALEHAACRRAMPLAVVEVNDKNVRSLYERDLILIRPDQHVGWRGNAIPQDADTLVNRLSGWHTD